MRFNRVLEDIKSYDAGKPIELVVREFGIDEKDIVKLASNENPYGTPPKAIEAIAQNASKAFLYPDDSMHALKSALAKRFGIANLIIGAGSDQIIEFAIHAKCNANSVILTSSVTFAMYDIYARGVGARVVKTASLHHDLEEFYALYQEHHPDMIFLCTPNNPTGDALDAKAVYDFIAKIDSNTLVVVDGAYMEYARYKDSNKAIEPKELIEAFDNVLYLGTFSKAYGLGGLRVGYGIANASIIESLYKLRPPFNITNLSTFAATKALEDEEFVQMSISKNFEQMARYEAFTKQMGLDYINSYTNFITLIMPEDKDSTTISDALLKMGVIVRNLRSYNLNAIRVTVGTSEQNSTFFEAFKKAYWWILKTTP